VFAAAGRAVNAADYGCFSLWYDSVTNNCGRKTFTIPLIADGTPGGHYKPVVTAAGASPANNVGCTAWAVDKTVTWVWTSSTQYLPAFGSAQDLILPVDAPAGGGLAVDCEVDTGGRIDIVNW